MPDPFPLSTPAAQEAQDRRRQMLRTAFGPTIAAALADPAVLEVMVNPDGRLWIDRALTGRADSGSRLGTAEVERIIRLVSAHVRREVTDKAPIVSAELPESGERFEGIMPPVAPAPCFAIRKPADVPYRLADYVAARIMSPPQAGLLAQAVRDRRNIVVAGGTSSGKTTLVNALLAEVADLGERVVILEDTRELRCAAEDVVTLRTKPGVASLADLVRSTLRLRPDRIIVGEVRGAEALDMLKAWNTGHPGGLTTVHANSAAAALTRLEQLMQEAVVTVPRTLIAKAIDAIVFIKGRGAERRVESILELAGLDADGDYALKAVSAPALHVCDPGGQMIISRTRRTSPILARLALAATVSATWLLASCHAAHAAGSGMPWEAPLQRILESIEGPVAKVVAVVVIIVTGLSLSFGDMGGAFRRMVQVVFGLSIAFAATSFFLSFFSFAGGALID